MIVIRVQTVIIHQVCVKMCDNGTLPFTPARNGAGAIDVDIATRNDISNDI